MKLRLAKASQQSWSLGLAELGNILFVFFDGTPKVDPLWNAMHSC